MLFIISTISVAWLIFPFHAHAYLDPGTGSILIQVVVAGLASVAITFKIFWVRIKQTVAGLFRKRDDDKPLE